ncbi:MAG: cysteine desulfurase family protein [Chloroflexota bacterium]
MPDDFGSDDIYLDHAATTPCDPRVIAAMTPYFGEKFGNPSSVYRLGQEARAAVDTARLQVARVLHCAPEEIIWAGGATEADNFAIKGVMSAARRRVSRPHLITTGIEHHAVLHAAERLRELAAQVTVLPVSETGIVSADEVAAAVRPETVLVSIMLANNECGAIPPVADIAKAKTQRGILVHTDAVQASGSLSLDVRELGVDLLVISAHKCYGPKGIGVLYARTGVELDPLLDGGGQESGRRGGTENVPGIVGCGLAVEQADLLRDRYLAHCTAVRNNLFDEIRRLIPDAQLNGPEFGKDRLPNNLSLWIPGLQGETLVLAMDIEGVAISAGSACTTGRTEPSHVLLAMGLGDDRARSSVRLTVGRSTTPEAAREAAQRLATCISRVRALAN